MKTSFSLTTYTQWDKSCLWWFSEIYVDGGKCVFRDFACCWGDLVCFFVSLRLEWEQIRRGLMSERHHPMCRAAKVVPHLIQLHLYLCSSPCSCWRRPAALHPSIFTIQKTFQILSKYSVLNLVLCPALTLLSVAYSVVFKGVLCLLLAVF